MDKMQKIAEADKHNVINQFQEVFMDYQAVNKSLFTLDMPKIFDISQKSRSEWSLDDKAKF